MKDPLELLHVHLAESEDGQPASFSHYTMPDSTVKAAGGDLVLRDSRESQAPRNLTMLVSLAGHTDAGSLSEQLAETLLGGLPHKQLASFGVDELFDYRSRRPRVKFTDHRFSDYEGPELNLYEVRDAVGRPFLLLTGDEPDFQWERVTQAVLALTERLDVSLVVLVDSLGLPVPHTRPLGVTAHGSRGDLIDGISTWSPDAQIEAGLAQVLEMRLDEEGHDVAGYTLHVPHYLAAGKYPQAAVAALEYSGAALELMLPTDELREAARVVDQEISVQVSRNDEVQGLVERLERKFDEQATTAPRSLLVKDDDVVPDAEELGAAVEEYLRNQPANSDSADEQFPGVYSPEESEDETDSEDEPPRQR